MCINGILIEYIYNVTSKLNNKNIIVLFKLTFVIFITIIRISFLFGPQIKIFFLLNSSQMHNGR